MRADEVSELHAAMRQYGIPGVLAPVDSANPAGMWRVYDRTDAATREDVTAEILAKVAAASRQRPARGFVVAAR